MLVATQYAWAAGALFFCGQDYYESQEIKSEYIKGGTVYLDIENQTFTVTNAVMNFDYWGHLMNGDSNALNLEIRPITNTNQPIQFEDQDIRSLCVNNWDTNGDGELSYAEAAAVTSLGNVFKNQPIVDFHELQYLTGLTEIGKSAFEGSYIRSTTIPINVASIARSAFRNTTSLNTVLIPYPSKLRTIGMFAFEGSSIRTLGAPLEVVTIDSYEFKNCTQLREITFGSDKIKTIGSEAFMGCAYLGSGIQIYLPRTLSAVGARAFKDCSYLNTGINWGYADQGVSIGAEAFSETKVNPIYINRQSTLNLKLDDNAFTGSRGDLKCYLSNCTYLIVRDYAATAVADVNGDGSVDVADMNAIINIILGI